MNPRLRICLVRHGETEWSLAGRHTGRTDIPLTADGRAMSRAAGAGLQSFTFARVLVSPRLRARQTCELAGFSAQAEIDPDLAEWDYGEFEGLRSIDILKDHRHWSFWRDGCPGGEVPAQVGARADRVIAKLQSVDGDVLVFSHGHFGRVLAARWLGEPVHQGWLFALDAASIGILGHETGHPAGPVISLWNAAGQVLQRDARCINASAAQPDVARAADLHLVE
jgi:broad specificity phosphatase PhoE